MTLFGQFKSWFIFSKQIQNLPNVWKLPYLFKRPFLYICFIICSVKWLISSRNLFFLAVWSRSEHYCNFGITSLGSGTVVAKRLYIYRAIGVRLPPVGLRQLVSFRIFFLFFLLTTTISLWTSGTKCLYCVSNLSNLGLKLLKKISILSQTCLGQNVSIWSQFETFLTFETQLRLPPFESNLRTIWDIILRCQNGVKKVSKMSQKGIWGGDLVDGRSFQVPSLYN